MAKQTNEEIRKDVAGNTDDQTDQPKVEKKPEEERKTEEKKKEAAVPEAEGEVQDRHEEASDEKAADQPDAQLLAEQVEELTAEIGSLKKEKEDLKNRLLRAQADFENYRKRTNKEKADARKYRAQDLTSDLLEILDNFKRALDVETASEDGAALKKGMEMVLNRFEAALKKEGVEEIDSLGKPFDPNFHQAVMQEESQEHESGTVIQVLQAGYTLNGRILRPAMVKVSA
ncbi:MULTISPECIES: nucleotide exchange factor GrpE [unclassified Sporolactobacillus]|uniref:nucleotide exchange factor GrpE n=1 Tax=unclassified Sporolactobacillus TaxID=2628533 RepID=UPI0023687763|nr:nucleotide exchange factor GrpE [Sporolactobacillus sp. CQH2019]MDD9147600.1 nucleotide exchange factor GrpE [Sporolactobacillus sp. CQH2019]